MEAYTLKSFAKINWVLEILNLRRDNYHNISAVFGKINFYDEIKIQLFESNKWEVNIFCNVKELEKENIIYNLFNILESIKNGVKYKVLINLKKNIPLGGGLGGGSSNVASILHFFYTKKIIDFYSALKLSKLLGSDVLPLFLLYLYPKSFIFCFEKQNLAIPYFGTNIVKNFDAFLLTFPFKVNTSEAYKEYDKFIKDKSYLIGTYTYRFLYYLKKPQLFYNYFNDLIYNDFEKVIYKSYPLINEVKEEIYEKNREVKVFLCGSGASLLVLGTPLLKLDHLINKGIKIIKITL